MVTGANCVLKTSPGIQTDGGVSGSLVTVTNMSVNYQLTQNCQHTVTAVSGKEWGREFIDQGDFTVHG